MTDTPSDRDPYAAPAPGQGPPPPPPGPPAAGYGGYSPYAQSTRPARNGMGVAALILGISSIVLCWTVIVGVVGGILAIIFGVIGRRRWKRREATNGGVALAGIITGAIGLVVTVIIVAAVGVFFVHHKDDIQRLNDCLRTAQTQQQQEQCRQEFQNSLNEGSAEVSGPAAR